MKLKQILVIIAALATISAGYLLASSVGAEVVGAKDLECSVLPQGICDSADSGELASSGVWKLSIWIINILTVGVGIVAVAAIVFAGFLYTTARDDQAQTKKAIEMIRNTMIGLVIYVFMFAILQYLIPGGLFTESGGSSAPPPPGRGGPMRPQ